MIDIAIEAKKQSDNYIFTDGVPGWCDFTEFYMKIAEWIKDGSQFCEVGSWLGASSIFMAKSLKRLGKTQVQVTCVDTWEGTPAEHGYIVKSMGGADGVFNQFKANVNEHGVSDLIYPVKSTSAAAARLFNDGRFSAVFLDADHSYEGVMNDICLWHQKVSANGILCGHDWPISTVQKAVTDFSIQRSLALSHRDSCWWFGHLP